MGVPGGADIKLRKVKANYHGNLRPHAWQLRFTDDNREAIFQKVDPLEVLPGGEATAKDRMLGALAAAGDRGMKSKDLAAEIGVTEAVGRAMLSKLKGQGLVFQSGGFWLLDDRQEEAPF